LITRHYRAVRPGPSLVEMLSPGSRSYLMRLLPADLSARWAVAVSPTSETTSALTLRGRGAIGSTRRSTP
jgi:hypothetical protein